MRTAVDAVQQVLLRPDERTSMSTKVITGERRKAVSPKALELRPERERFASRRETCQRKDFTVPQAGESRHAIDVATNIDGLRMAHAVHSISKVFLDPGNLTFDVDKSRRRLPPQSVPIFHFQVVLK